MVGSSPATYVATFSGTAPSGYRDAVLADAPLAYWRLGESGGATAADSSGNGRIGTYVNAPTLGSPGLLPSDADTSVTFNGVDEHVSVQDAPVWNLTGDLTVEALVNVTGGRNYRTIVAKHRASDDTSTFELRIYATNGRLQFVQKTTSGTYLTVTSNAVLTVGATYHVAVTKQGTTVRLYVNGALDKTATFSSPVASNASPVRIRIGMGRRRSAGSTRWRSRPCIVGVRIGAHAAGSLRGRSQPPDPPGIA